MTTPLGALVRGWRGAFVAWVLAAAAPACGDDKSASPPAETGGTGVDAGAPVVGGVGGSGGSGGSEAAAGTGFISPVIGSGGTPTVPNTPPMGGPCAAGSTQACTLDLLCTGVTTCGADGTFGSCVCDTTQLVGGGVVGARCESDADCAMGATCLSADSDVYLGAGGPAGGYCSFPCTVLGQDPYDDDCDERDPQSFCAPLGPDDATYCIRTCLSLDPAPGEAKCLNRNDLVCVSRAAGGSEPFNGMRQQGYCAPQCGSDEDCPAGRVCHAQAGICTDAQVPGTPVGGACSLDTDCSGLACEDRNSEDVGVCTASCTLGSLSGCGYGRDDPDRGAACLTPQVAAGRFSEGVGDLGFCRELCDVPEECEQAGIGWICTPLSPAAQEFVGRIGACVPPG